MPFPRASQALSRFTVLDLTRVRSGPTCVRQLADWGANVIKIETPPHLEEGEGPGGPREGCRLPEPAPQQAQHHARPEIAAGPRRVQAHGREGRRRGGEFPPRREGPARHRLRGAEEDQQAHRARAASPASARTGLIAKRPGFDQIAQGMGGLMSITGLPGRGRCASAFRSPICPPACSARSAFSIALLEREVSGEGQWVNTSLLQAQIFMLDFQAARWLTEGTRCRSRPATIIRPASRPACSRPPTATSTSPSTGQVMWERLCNALRRARADQASRLRDRRAALEKPRRAQRRDRQARPCDKTSAEWVEIFNKAGVPCGPIYAIDQVFADPQVKHLGIAKERQASDGSDSGLRRPAGDAVAHAEQDRGDAAGAGEHTDEVLKEFGFADNEIAELAQGTRRCEAVSQRLAMTK